MIMFSQTNETTEDTPHTEQLGLHLDGVVFLVFSSYVDNYVIHINRNVTRQTITHGASVVTKSEYGLLKPISPLHAVLLSVVALLQVV